MLACNELIKNVIKFYAIPTMDIRKSSEEEICCRYSGFLCFSLSMYIMPNIIEHGETAARRVTEDAQYMSTLPNSLGAASCKNSTASSE